MIATDTLDTRAAMDLSDIAVVDRLLTTTRAVRRRLDINRPVEREVIEECLDVAVHAPSASNQQSWRWVVVTDPEKKREVQRIYGWAWNHYLSMSAGKERRFGARSSKRDQSMRSAEWLTEHMDEVPALVIPCILGRPPKEADIDEQWSRQTGAMRNGVPAPKSVGLVRLASFFGSIYPAVWSFQLALRSRGIGSAITCMHLPFEAEVGELLGIPRSVTQTCLVPLGYITGGDLTPGVRRPAAELTSWESWGSSGR